MLVTWACVDCRAETSALLESLAEESDWVCRLETMVSTWRVE